MPREDRTRRVLPPSATAGPPTAGAHLKGELALDVNLVLYICITAGTPGTWDLAPGLASRVQQLMLVAPQVANTWTSFVPKVLYRGQPATGGTTCYTVPANKGAIVKQIIITNTDATTAYPVSIRTVESGGAAGVTKSIAEALSIPAASVQTLDVSIPLDTGDFIQALQGTTGKVTLTICGMEAS